jgi:hypothetical protein
LYDNLTLKDVSGKLIQGREANYGSIKRLMMVIIRWSYFDKRKVPTFNMDLSLKQVDIAQSFTQLDLLKNSPYSRNHQWKIKFNNKIEWKSYCHEA